MERFEISWLSVVHESYDHDCSLNPVHLLRDLTTCIPWMPLFISTHTFRGSEADEEKIEKNRTPALFRLVLSNHHLALPLQHLPSFLPSLPFSPFPYLFPADQIGKRRCDSTRTSTPRSTTSSWSRSSRLPKWEPTSSSSVLFFLAQSPCGSRALSKGNVQR
jgi:hypothetical protein